MIFVLAHGGLGNWDEFFFLGIAILFTVFMGISWWRSRHFETEIEDAYPTEENKQAHPK